MRPFVFPALALVSALAAQRVLAADYSASVQIDATQRTAISPYVYGTNQDMTGVAPTARRQGGNRMTGYNWENNASNAGQDYFHQSDNYLTWVAGISDTIAATPGIVVTRFHDDSLSQGVPYSIVTLPMAGYVAKDKAGVVSAGDTAPSSRWVEVKNNKPTALSTTPDLNDGAVYTDEYLNLLLQRYGSASTGRGIKGYNLDNEPALWPSTHPRIHPVKTTCEEIVTRGVDTAKTIKRLDASAEVYGPVLYGVGAYINFQSAPDWTSAKASGNYTWFIDYYLAELKKAGATAGRRLLDVLDVHYYSEQIGGGVRINDTTDYNNIDCNKARMQAPRSLWDPTFVENSWIGQYNAWVNPILPKLRASIDAHYPGTKLAVTEYNFGGGAHISGGIAQADTLGIFGAQGVYLGALWVFSGGSQFQAAAFKLYRNYDNAGGNYGDTALSTSYTAVSDLSAFASVDAADDKKLHVILLNKNYDSAGNISVQLSSASRTYTRARVFGFDSSSASVTERAGLSSITNNQFTYRVPALSALHLVLEAEDTNPPPPSSNATRLINISTRSFVGTGERILVAGFVIGGSGTKKVFLRAAGPALAPFGLNGLLANPEITLTKQNGEVIAKNDDWGQASNLAEVTTANQNTGFTFPTGSKDAAMIVTLPAGPYTLLVSGVSETTGVALVEVYDLEPTSQTRLINLSSRAQVGSGSETMIAGFVLSGSDPRKLLVRAVGPGLVQFGVSQAATDPSMQLTTPTGVLLMENNDWSSGGQTSEINTVGSQTGAFPLVSGSKDAALVTTRTGDGYTALVTGTGTTNGIALVEVYEAP